MNRKQYLFIISLFVFLITNLSVGASTIKIKVNAKYISPDVEPFVVNSCTYVPIRFISEALNADEIIWKPENSSIIIKSDNKTLLLFVNKNYAYVNNQYRQLTNNVLLVNSRTFVPLRFISECLDAKVDWNQETYTVSISNTSSNTSSKVSDSSTSISNIPPLSNGNSSISTSPSKTPLEGQAVTDKDSIYWLSRIIEAEAGGEPFKGKVAVGEVILNRVNSNEFPNTIWGVIFDNKFGIQFEPVANGTIYNTPSEESILAAKTAINGSNYVGNCLYFLNPSIAQSNWISKTRQYYTTITNHEFYV